MFSFISYRGTDDLHYTTSSAPKFVAVYVALGMTWVVQWWYVCHVCS